LRQPLAAVFLRRTLGLGHAVEQVHRAEHGGEDKQNERDGNLQRRGNAQGHFGRSARGPGDSMPSMSSPARSNFASTMSAMSLRPVTANSGFAPPSMPRFSSRDGT